MIIMRKRTKKTRKKMKKGPPPLETRIIEALKRAGRPIFRREILHLAHVRPEEKGEAKALINELVRSGQIVKLKGSRYGLLDMMTLIQGELRVHPDGFGFVVPEKEGEEDIFIPPRGLKGGLHGDKVLARIERITKKGPEGSIVRIIERGRDRLVGTLFRSKSIAIVTPEDDRFPFDVIVPRKDVKGVKSGTAVVVKLLSPDPEKELGPRTGPLTGRVVEVLGDPDDLEVQTKIVIRSHDLPHVFGDEAQREAASLPRRVRKEDLRGRRDLRKLPFVTIDGDTAKDFDDAVYVKKMKTGYELYVSIADVSHYVPMGSPLDEEAYRRGTSVYFPNSVVPMFPEELSNWIASLVPNEDRLTVTAKITYDLRGNIRRTAFYPSVIRSKRRYTYSEVRDLLQSKECPKDLRVMEELCDILNKKRIRRGSLDFDLPEPKIVIGLQGELEEIVRRERNKAHQIIEEFMIAANEAVATFLLERDIPVLLRVHEPPDREKLLEFKKYAESVGIHVEIPEEVTPKFCQRVLREAKGKPFEHMINTLLLRSMKQAVYSPDNIGHFGLASPKYLHFTSPIRRYPDLVVHRVLKANRRRIRKRPVYTHERLEVMGRHCSERERTAMEAEREMFDRLKVRYMKDRIGEVFTGTITNCTGFGFFVELDDLFIDGAVKLVDLADDYYVFDKENMELIGRRTGRRFRIGQKVRVRLESVNIHRRHINFVVVSEKGDRR